MIKEIQFQRRKKTIYAMDENYAVVGQWECRDDFVKGYNSEGDPRGSLPNGLYTHVHAEVTNGCYGPAFGNFYILFGADTPSKSSPTVIIIDTAFNSCILAFSSSLSSPNTLHFS